MKKKKIIPISKESKSFSQQLRCESPPKRKRRDPIAAIAEPAREQGAVPSGGAGSFTLSIDGGANVRRSLIKIFLK